MKILCGLSVVGLLLLAASARAQTPPGEAPHCKAIAALARQVSEDRDRGVPLAHYQEAARSARLLGQPLLESTELIIFDVYAMGDRSKWTGKTSDRGEAPEHAAKRWYALCVHNPHLYR